MRSTPRVLLILTEFPPRIGGMQTHAIHLSQALHRKGYQLEVVTLQSVKEDEQAGAEAFDRQLPFPVHRILSRIGYQHNLKLLRRACQRFQPDLLYSSTVFYGKLSSSVQLPMICRSVGNDVLRPWIVYPFRPLSRLLSSRWFERSAYQLFRRLDYPEPLETIWRKRRYALMTESAKDISLILANSQFTANLLSEIGVREENLAIVSGGVDSQRFSKPATPTCAITRQTLGIPEERFVLMTACRMVRKKGVDFLLSEMELLLKKIPDAQLLLVGSGRHFRKFQTLARNSSAADRITFTGSIPHSDIQQYYSLADVFVLASRIQVDPATGVRDAETMGRVLCEANSAGIPVIAGRSGGIPSVIRDGFNGLLFTPDDMDDLCACLLRLRADPELRESLIHNGRRRSIEEFDWSVILNKHEQFFAQFLPNHSTLPS